MNDVDQISKNNANHIEGINQPSTADGAQKKWLYALYFFGLLSLLSLAALIYYLNKVTDYVSSINDLEVYSGSMVRDVNEALFSDDPAVKEAAYQQLESDISNYETSLMNAQASALDNEAFYEDLSQQWSIMKPEVQSVLENSNSFNSLADGTEQVEAAVETIQNLYMQATQQATAIRLGSEQIAGMQQQLIVSEKIAENFSNLNSSISTSTTDLESVTNTFAENLQAQQQAYGTYVPALLEIEQTFNNMVIPEIRKVTDDNTSIFELRDNTRAVSDLAIKTQNQLAEVNREILTRPRIILPALAFITSLFMGLFSMFQLSRVRDRTERLLIEKETLRQRQDMEVESDRARKIQEENERNQMAILRLLDELGDLAEGDLTVNATVSEDFTGAIADSVNFAIDQLRQLVLAINTTAVRVAQSSEQTQMTAVELAEASEHQAQEIAGVSAAINEMAVSIDQVSSNATESATVAQRSVAIAHNGAEVVQRSIEGMNTIREQIQETSKRIKRLGESSQEIGDIIGLINDIADQTNVLALNAAIQASMAGEAGRGFAVVADEVQRLAERSANATKQIESLVKTIQADTNEAVMSMESTTTEVVRGAGLAKDAGEALEEVQTVSNTLADLIQNISNAAQQQASSAGHISKTMNVIQDITSQTSSGTLATARSVGQLNEMAAALQESVSGFKLDNDEDEVLLQDL